MLFIDCHYLKDFKIPLISGNLFNDLKNSYTGGATDMYIPKGENIFCYDVNSLYPFVMKNSYMPVGNITYFEGDITKIFNNPYGFFEVKVTTPKDLKHPILINKSNKGAIAPLGT